MLFTFSFEYFGGFSLSRYSGPLISGSLTPDPLAGSGSNTAIQAKVIEPLDLF